ncbi:MAG: DedA family protein [Candidatus Dadabacteria bacterium]|nr:MAG: DedA family protein [Candidatus Dadabacteria bacterium]
MNRLRLLAILLFVGAAVGAAILLLAGDEVEIVLQRVLAEPPDPSRAHIAMIVLSLLLVAGGVVIYPIAVVIVVGAALFGVDVALWTYPATLAGAVVGWLLGRAVGEGSLERFPPGAVRRLFELVQRFPVLSALLARCVPGLPFALQNTGLGAAGVAWWPYLGGTAVGIAVTHSVFVASGAAASSLLAEVRHAIVSGWIGIGVVVVIAVVLWRQSTGAVPAD